MARISIISNFDLSSESPIDYRVVSDSVSDRESIFYKYDGLQTYVISENKTYTWSNGTWSVNGKDGIYAGSGSLKGNTLVNLGVTGDYTTSSSTKLSFIGYTSDNIIYDYSNIWNRTYDGNTSLNIEFNSGVYNSGLTVSYISLQESSTSIISFNGVMELSSIGTLFIKRNPLVFGYINGTNLTQNRTHLLPNKSGVIALTSDIPSFTTQSLQSVTTYGYTTSVGIKSYTDYFSTAANLFIGVGSNVRNWITYNNTSGSGMYYLVQTTASVASSNTHYMRMNSYTASINENYLTYNQYLSGQGQLFLGSLTISSDRNIYFPNKSGTVSLTSNINSSIFNIGYTIYNKVDNNPLFNYVLSSTTPTENNFHLPTGLTGTSLFMAWSISTIQPRSWGSAWPPSAIRTLQIPSPTSSIAGEILLIKNYQGFDTSGVVDATLNARTLQTTIPYWYGGATYTTLPNLGSSTMLICDGTRWTRIAYVSGNNSNDPDEP